MASTAVKCAVALDLLQLPDARFFNAAANDRISLRSLCDCLPGGSPAKQHNVCENPKCGKDYSSAQGLPLRAWPRDNPQVIVPKERLDEAKSARKVESFAIQKTVDLAAFLARYTIGEPYYVLPPEKATDSTLRLYRLFVEALGQSKRGAVAPLTIRGTTHRLILIADETRNLLVAYKVFDLREPPYEVQRVTVDDKDRRKAAVFLDDAYQVNPDFPAEADPVMLVLEEELKRMQAQALGEAVTASATAPEPPAAQEKAVEAKGP